MANTVFRCWKCEAELRRLPGETHAVPPELVTCPACGEVQGITYIHPHAPVYTED